MNRFKLIAMALPLALSSAAFAADSGSGISEYQHQAAGGKWEVAPGFTFGSIKSTYDSTYSGNLSSSTDSLFNFTVGGEYGINDMIAVGLKLGYQSDSISFSPDQGVGKMSASGMTDPVIYEKTKMDIGGSTLTFGGDLDISPGNHTYDQTANSMKANEYSGGITLTPYVGWEMNVGPGIVGARLAYDLIQTNQKWKDNTSANSANPHNLTIKGSNQLSFAAFWEMTFNPLIWGVDIGVLRTAGSKYSDDANAAAGDTDAHDAQSNLFVETYANWAITPDISILPKIGYGPQGAGWIASALANGQNGSSGIYFNVAARFTF